jgi:hypothetical protein
MRQDPVVFERRARTLDYFIDARPIEEPPARPVETSKVTIGVCVNCEEELRDNLLASPCLKEGRHEILKIEGAASAAEGLNAVIECARNEVVVLVHQDVYLPAGWIARVLRQYDLVKAASGGRVGVLGIYGATAAPRRTLRLGRVFDRDTLLDEPGALPAPADSLDELALIVPKSTPLRFDPALGWHLYGTDICLSAKEAGLQSAVIDAPCHHNSRSGYGVPPEFEESKAVLRKKWWRLLPITAVCAIIE